MTDNNESWIKDLDPEEYAHLFPRGQADVDAWTERVAWREKHQDFPRTCEDPGALFDLAVLMGAYREWTPSDREALKQDLIRRTQT